jgi:5'(3')-deoxyribonucleotidase
MRIALDLDDVLADLIGGLIQVHAETNGRRLSRCEAVDWSVFPDAVHEHMLENGGYACLAPREGAAEFLPWIAREHDVFIVTYRREEARALTRSWLASHFPGVCPPRVAPRSRSAGVNARK